MWPHVMFLELKVTYILKSSGWGLEKSKLPWELKQIFVNGKQNFSFSWNCM